MKKKNVKPKKRYYIWVLVEKQPRANVKPGVRADFGLLANLSAPLEPLDLDRIEINGEELSAES